MQNRINRLENLVLSLMNNGPHAPDTTEAPAAMSAVSTTDAMHTDPEEGIGDNQGDDSDVNDVSQRIGIMKVADGKAWYASDAHWYTILADVSVWVGQKFTNHPLSLFYGSSSLSFPIYPPSPSSPRGSDH